MAIQSVIIGKMLSFEYFSKGYTTFTRSDERKSHDMLINSHLYVVYVCLRVNFSILTSLLTVAKQDTSSSKPPWACDLHPVGLHYYSGVVDNVEELLESHKIATQSSRSSLKKYVPSVNKENHDPNQSRSKVSTFLY